MQRRKTLLIGLMRSNSVKVEIQCANAYEAREIYKAMTDTCKNDQPKSVLGVSLDVGQQFHDGPLESFWILLARKIGVL